MLGGRDLRVLIDKYPQLGSKLHWERRGADIFFSSVKGEDENARMIVDHEGLFSVTNRKWSVAMANVVRFALDSTLGWDPKSTEIWGLTASVGGMTLGMSERFPEVRRILALEADPLRADLCRKNVDRHSARVEVRNVDSIEVLPELFAEMTPDTNICILLDPPWGGEDYKLQYEKIGHRKKRQPDGPQNLIEMGKWSLYDAIERIADHMLSPFVVLALKLPVTLAIDSYLKQLSETRYIRLDTIQIRKMSVQLFVLIKLHKKS